MLPAMQRVVVPLIRWRWWCWNEYRREEHRGSDGEHAFEFFYRMDEVFCNLEAGDKVRVASLPAVLSGKQVLCETVGPVCFDAPIPQQANQHAIAGAVVNNASGPGRKEWQHRFNEYRSIQAPLDLPCVLIANWLAVCFVEPVGFFGLNSRTPRALVVSDCMLAEYRCGKEECCRFAADSAREVVHCIGAGIGDLG